MTAAKIALVLYYITTGGEIESDILDHDMTMEDCLENAPTIAPLAIQNREVYAITCETQESE